MPYSLRVKIKKLRYKGTITDKECDRLCKALDNEGVLDKIRAEIEEQKKERCCDDNDMFIYRMGLDDALYIIDKYRVESEGKEEKR